MKGRKSNINDAGISLLELIIAVSIFAIAAVVFTGICHDRTCE